MSRRGADARVFHHTLTHFIRFELKAEELKAGAKVNVRSLPAGALVTAIYGYCVTAFNGGGDVFKVETDEDTPISIIADGDVNIAASVTLTPQITDIGFVAQENTPLTMTYTAGADPTEGEAFFIIQYIPREQSE